MNERGPQRGKPSGILRRMILEIVSIGLAAYAGLAVYMFIFQSRYVYYPLREIEMTPWDAGLAYEDVSLTAADGVRLAAWFVPAEEPRGTVLFCHGNGGNISHRMESLAIFRSLGMNTLIFDYRGYGTSGGSPSEEGTYLDAAAAWAYLTKERGVDPSRVVVFGRSLGGAIATRLAMERAPAALIVESSFTSVPDLASEYYFYLPARIICRFGYDTRDYIAGVKCPVLIVHSPEDDMVPYRHGRKIFEAAGEPKRFLEIRGAHNDGFLLTGGPYERGLEKFLKEFL